MFVTFKNSIALNKLWLLCSDTFHILVWEAYELYLCSALSVCARIISVSIKITNLIDVSNHLSRKEYSRIIFSIIPSFCKVQQSFHYLSKDNECLHFSTLLGVSNEFSFILNLNCLSHFSLVVVYYFNMRL